MTENHKSLEKGQGSSNDVYVSNADFLESIFGQDSPFVHVTDFPDDPLSISAERQSIAWRGNWASKYSFSEGTNQYFTISIFQVDDQGAPRRRKALFLRTCCVVLDDVREKLSVEAAALLPKPSWILETSAGSEQWGYILAEPCIDAAKIDNLNDGLIESELAPSGKDPGQRGVTRYVRLPEGSNTKASKMVEGRPFKCRMLKWEPELKVQLEELAAPFSIDLNKPRKMARQECAANIPEHPFFSIPNLIRVKTNNARGRLDVTCPWVGEHSGQADDGAAIFTNEDGTFGFKCHHGTCETRTGEDLMRFIEERKPGFQNDYKDWSCLREFGAIQNVKEPPELPINSLFSDFEVSKDVIDSMSDPVWLYKNLLILGHLVAIPAPPNAGKTTIFLHIAAELAAEGYEVYYVNADVAGGDAKPMHKAASDAGFKLLLPDMANKSMDEFVRQMEQLLGTNRDLSSVIVIIDTLKKMTDVINKKAAKEIYKTLRSLTGRGMTVVLLAHTNKYKGEDGNYIYEGTGDLRSDVDELIYMEPVKNADGSMLVSTRPDKVRGVFEPITFNISPSRIVTLQERFVDTNQLQSELEQIRNDKEVIDAIDLAIDAGCKNQGEIIKHCRENYKFGTPRIRRVLSTYSSEGDSEQKKWSVSTVLNNARMYTKVCPKVVSFL